MGIANVHYIRYQRRFLLLATHGFHPLYDDEARSIRDARRIPIRFEGYSVSVARGFLRKSATPSLPCRTARAGSSPQIEREHYQA